MLMIRRLLFAAVVLAGCLLHAGTAEAFPFGKDSGVTELTPKTLPGFLNTHKPVFIMFYAPWCGHCKQLHPAYQEFGAGVKDVVRVGAINADQYKELGGQFGIKGFPTIKYWKMGSKKGMQPLDYQGQRTKNGLHNAALAEITHNVKTAANAKQVTDALKATGKAVVLFSQKNKPPPIFSVLSQSPHFKDKFAFVLVPEKAKDIVSAYDVTSFPTIVVLAAAESDAPTKEVYSGAVDYTSLAKFLKEQLGESTGSADGEDGTEGTTASSKPDGKKKAAGETKGEEKDKEKEKEAPVKHSRPATPVRPVPLTAESFQTFCSFGAPKVNGQQPFCLVVLGDGDEFNDIYEGFSKDSVLFFYTGEEKAPQYIEDLQVGLKPSPPIGRGDIIALRAAKDRTKFTTWRAGDAHTAPGDTLSAWIERCLAGEITFEKHPFFPKIR